MALRVFICAAFVSWLGAQVDPFVSQTEQTLAAVLRWGNPLERLAKGISSTEWRGDYTRNICRTGFCFLL
jgi:hypothetical protein